MEQINNKEDDKSQSTEKIQKSSIKCNLMKFCGTLELDGCFKYTGKK